VTPLICTCLALVPASALLCAATARLMRRWSLGQPIRTLGPKRHAAKAGTPTMGGLVVFVLWWAAVATLFAWQTPTRTTWFVLAAGGSFAAIGTVDDAISVRKRRSKGLSAVGKLALSSLAVVSLFLIFRDVLSVPVSIPFATTTMRLPPAATFALAWIVFLSTTNGMNLTDGLDGLAAGVAILILAGALLLRPSLETLLVGAPLIASLVGFLWVNVHPADLFLGDAGSFFLGGTIASVCLADGTALLLPILAGVLVLEVGSVILQVSVYKTTGRRLFRMSPLHHHFESTVDGPRKHLLPAFSWPEGKVTVRFWILESAFVGLALLAGRFGSLG
jgi:phospho-N-acetylmuramoyl-pentapeptide-transferase